MASFIFKLGSLDLSQYVRVGPQDGMDPYGSGWLDPAFSDAPLGEGQPLLLVDAKNREMVWPVYLNVATNKDGLHSLIASVNREISYGARPLRVEWRDAGATVSTFYDVTYARVDPHFNFRLSDQEYADCAIRVWCAPPFGHTATERIVATAVGTTGAIIATIPVGSVVGDAPALAQFLLTTSGVPVGPGGRSAFVALLPNASYTPFISAASFPVIHPAATIVGASGAPGSQALQMGTASAPFTGNLGRFGLTAAYVGRNRVFGAVQPGRVQGAALSITNAADRPIGPTGIAKGLDGFQLIDLGVADVGTVAATYTFTIGAGRVPILPNDAPLNTTVGQHAQIPRIAGVFVVPEDAAVAHIDGLANNVSAKWFGASGAATYVPGLDDFGNTYVEMNSGLAPTGLLSGPSGLIPYGSYAPNPALIVNIPPVANLRSRAVFKAFAINNSDSVSVGRWDVDTGVGAFTTVALHPSQTYINVVAVDANQSISAGASLFLQPTSLHAAASTAFVLDVVGRGSALYANVRLTNATGIGIYTGGAGVGPTTVPVACVGFTNSGLDAIRGRPMLILHTANVMSTAPSAPLAVLNLEYAAITGGPVPSDQYTLDGVSGTSRRATAIAGGVGLRGAIPKLPPASAVRVVAFDGQIDGGPMNDPLAVEIRVRERFAYSRY